LDGDLETARCKGTGLVKQVLVVIPVKDLKQTKSRLRPVLSLLERQALTLRILWKTIQTLKSSVSVESILVLTPDEHVLSFAKVLGVQGLKEKTKGLNQALREAARWAIDHDFGATLVVPSDIPYINKVDIELIRSMAMRKERLMVIAPNRNGRGTNVLLMKPPGILKYSFGVNSFERHRQEAMARNVEIEIYSSASVAFDLDTSEEYRLLLEKERVREKTLGHENEAGHIDPDSGYSPH
jgi:2-phospho-L-lactate/phosphoenolpyruvate guanylyltransferase